MAQFAFGRSRRLSSRPEYLRLRETPVVVRGRCCIVFYRHSHGKKSRLGMTFKGKVSSVERSRIKRTVREWFRTGFPVATEKGYFDLNVFVNFPLRLSGNASATFFLKEDLGKIHEEIFRKTMPGLS